jgi:hypothetical protein
MNESAELFSAEVETSWEAPPRGKSFFAGLMDLVSALAGDSATPPTEVYGDPRWRVVLRDRSDQTILGTSPWSTTYDGVERLREEWAARLPKLTPEEIRAGAVLRDE